LEHSVVCRYAASVRFSPTVRGLIHLLRMRLFQSHTKTILYRENGLVTCDEERMKKIGSKPLMTRHCH